MRNFSARETEWMLELDGIELAGFWPRAFAFVIDWVIVGIVLTFMASLIALGVFVHYHRKGMSIEEMSKVVVVNDGGKDATVVIAPNGKGWKYTAKASDEHSTSGELMNIFTDALVSCLYFGILMWKGKGRTPGKRLMKIRVVSIVHRHLSFWHCVERALGYGAAFLEGGFGFVQFFIHPYRRCAQDRLAETIVVTERGYQAMQYKLEHKLLPDTPANAAAAE